MTTASGNSGGLYEAYEVFVQYDVLEPHQYVGSVLASSTDMALIVARENFLRRDKAHSLWVVPKRFIAVKTSEDVDFFAVEFDRDYRRVDGYADNARRWKAFKLRAMEIDEVVEDVKHAGSGNPEDQVTSGDGLATESAPTQRGR
ncbi:phenylacetic acid degradation protein [Alicyclobacillus sp. ALC3]|uniref:phenylacetic acid degradation protein n=1 Tax=Alicyclobacillus sp. ALC3 TaxID=2796143 RepID=UPI002378C600|nr:phenylacetic acid degradation protein [Alicyclobacillus sp. ALC3]WDL96220.1 phenylacetic acid degradation protein [Alicyclobacillus sp. ALC3]